MLSAVTLFELLVLAFIFPFVSYFCKYQYLNTYFDPASKLSKT